ncbi:MAG: hypothetical protein NC347_13630 [Clostridium sp.]|nr:hypothetical protein [Clostridium sp.]
MVTLTFVFDKDRIEKAGYTEDELLQPMREHAQKYGILENQHGVFSKDGEDALCVLSMAVPQITEMNPQYLNLLAEWTLDMDGEKEDCIKETREWYAEHGLQAIG